jgi:spermidine synthase
MNAIMAKIKIKYVSKGKIKHNSQYFPMETQDKFKNKGVIKCIDENNIPGFYEKSIICMAFYLDLKNFPNNTVKIMDIGAGLGIMSFYLHKLFKGNCEIDNIEKNKWIYDIGIKIFGLKNYCSQNNRVNWYLEDAQTCMNKMINPKNENKYENKIEFYDLIINEINDINPKEFCSPPASNFNDEFLGSIKKFLKKKGVYIINLQARNFKILYENYKQIAKYFPTCYVISSESGLVYIFICFKENLSTELYGDIFQRNKEKIMPGKNIDSTLIEPFYRDVISKIKSVNDEIKKMEDNAKKI